MKTIQRFSQFDVTIQDLCYKVDDLQAEINYWKEKYDSLLQEMNQQTAQRLEESNKAIANALRFAFSVTDDADGNLIIDSESRKNLAENWNR